MAWTLSTAERSGAGKAFVAMNASSSGTVSFAELSAVLSDLGADEKEASQIFDALDMGNKGQVGYSDFLASMCVSDELLSEQRLDEVFNCLDSDRSGLITTESLRELSKSKSCETLSTCVHSLSPTASLNSSDFAAQLRNAASSQALQVD